MAIRVTMTVGLRDEGGVVFGTLSKVSDRHLLVQSEATYERGQRLEFQFALEGRRTSVQGDAVVVRITPHELPHGPTSYALKIAHLAPGKEAAYREWLYDLAHGGGSSARPHRDHASSITSSVSNAAERRAAGERRLAAMDRQRTDRRSSSVVSSIAGSSASAARAGVGRQALRNALRGFAVRSVSPESVEPGDSPRRQRMEVEPIVGDVPPARPTPRRQAPPLDDISVPPPSDISHVSGRSRKGRRKRVEIRVRMDTDPPRIEARFADAGRYLAMYRDHLDRDVLFLRHDQLDLPLDARVRARLLLPTDDVVLCDARVAAQLPSGVGFVLKLDDDDRSLLRRTAARLLRERK